MSYGMFCCEKNYQTILNGKEMNIIGLTTQDGSWSRLHISIDYYSLSLGFAPLMLSLI